MVEFAWALSFLRPYRGRSLLVVALALIEIGLAAMAPWPMKAIVDNVFGGRPFPEPLQSLTTAVSGGSPGALLVLVAIAGFGLQLVHELVRAAHTQVGVTTAQGIVY